jgi:hypothetical protein
VIAMMELVAAIAVMYLTLIAASLVVRRQQRRMDKGGET